MSDKGLLRSCYRIDAQPVRVGGGSWGPGCLQGATGAGRRGPRGPAGRVVAEGRGGGSPRGRCGCSRRSPRPFGCALVGVRGPGPPGCVWSSAAGASWLLAPFPAPLRVRPGRGSGSGAVRAGLVFGRGRVVVARAVPRAPSGAPRRGAFPVRLCGVRWGRFWGAPSGARGTARAGLHRPEGMHGAEGPRRVRHRPGRVGPSAAGAAPGGVGPSALGAVPRAPGAAAVRGAEAGRDGDGRGGSTGTGRVGGRPGPGTGWVRGGFRRPGGRWP